MTIHFMNKFNYLLIVLLFSFTACSEDDKVSSGAYIGNLFALDNQEIPFNLYMLNDGSVEIYNHKEIVKMKKIVYIKDSFLIKSPVFEGYIKAKKSSVGMEGYFFNNSLDRKIKFNAYPGHERFKLKNSSINYNKVYHITHSLNHYRYNKYSNTEKIPVHVRLELIAQNIGDFQLPSGSYKVYNKQDDNLTYIGTDIYGISQKEDKIKLEIGKTQDIVCTFNIDGHEVNRNTKEMQLSAIFQNYKTDPVQIIWIEKFSDGRWEILESNQDYTKIDAFHAEFTINLKANSKKEIQIKTRIQKK